MSQARATLLTSAIRASGLGRELSAALARWWRPAAVHDPAKVLLGLAVAAGLGGDCLADIAVLRAEPGVFGRVVSDPTVSRTIDALAADAPAALRAIHAARSAAAGGPGNWAGSTPPLASRSFVATYGRGGVTVAAAAMNVPHRMAAYHRLIAAQAPFPPQPALAVSPATSLSGGSS